MPETLPQPDPGMVEFVNDERNHDNRFVADLYVWLDEHDGTLTMAQRGALGRIMREQGWAPDLNGRWRRLVDPGEAANEPDEAMEHLLDEEEGSARLTPDDATIEQRRRSSSNTPADWNAARDILSGEFEVSTSIATHRFRIFTIRQSRTASLVHKRIVGRFDPATQDWENFGYLTTSGHLRLWSRFNDQTDEPWVLYARMLLNVLSIRRHEVILPALRRTLWRDPEGVVWNVEFRRRTCRYCGERMALSAQLREGADNCSARRNNDPEFNIDDDFDAREEAGDVDMHDVPPTPISRFGRRTPQLVEVHTYSELGTGWER